MIIMPDKIHWFYNDIVGPLPAATCGSRYLFTVVDSYSRWLEALPMSDIAAATCTDTLIAGWISRSGSVGAADLGPGHTVYLGHLGRPVRAAGHPAPANHRLSPPGEWYGATGG
jgi:hypothetical protein